MDRTDEFCFIWECVTHGFCPPSRLKLCYSPLLFSSRLSQVIRVAPSMAMHFIHGNTIRGNSKPAIPGQRARSSSHTVVGLTAPLVARGSAASITSLGYLGCRRLPDLSKNENKFNVWASPPERRGFSFDSAPCLVRRRFAASI